MTLALRSPDAVGALISVDNAPVDAALKNGFVKYVQGMKEIDDSKVTKQADADGILKKYENVGRTFARRRNELSAGCLLVGYINPTVSPNQFGSVTRQWGAPSPDSH